VHLIGDFSLGRSFILVLLTLNLIELLGKGNAKLFSDLVQSNDVETFFPVSTAHEHVSQFVPVLELLPEVMYHRVSTFAVEVLLLLFDDGHHFLSEEAIGRHELDFSRRFNLGTVTYSFILVRLVMLRRVIRAATVASSGVVEEWKSDFMYFFLELVDLRSAILHFDVKDLLKILSLFFIFKSFRFFNFVLPL